MFVILRSMESYFKTDRATIQKKLEIGNKITMPSLCVSFAVIYWCYGVFSDKGIDI